VSFSGCNLTEKSIKRSIESGAKVSVPGAMREFRVVITLKLSPKPILE